MRSDATSRVFAALSDPTRRKIVEALEWARPLSVSEITELVPMTRQAVTKHLDVLGRAGVCETIWRGRERLTSLADEPFEPARSWLERQEEFWDERLAELKRQIEAEGSGE